MLITLTNNFNDPAFQNAFKTYFQELGISITDWNSLWKSMQDEGGNKAFLIRDDAGSVLAFIQFREEQMDHWFFKESFGFIRELWVHPDYRRQKLGTALMEASEAYFKEKKLCRILLTSDTADTFYRTRGYLVNPAVHAKNQDPVYMKQLEI